MLENFLFNLNSIDDTKRLGVTIGNIAQPADVICLNGCLGAGKTTLTQAIARGLGVPSSCYVTSPSYAIMHEYKGVIPLYHMDFYRLNDSADIIDLGFEEYFYLDGLTVIEWSERAEDILPQDRVSIAISLNKDQGRIARFFTSNNTLAGRYEKMLVTLLKISKP